MAVPAGVARLLRSQDFRRLASCWAIGLVVDVMTGAAGSNTAPTAGLAADLGHPRVLVFLALGTVLWLGLTAYGRRREQVRARIQLVSTNASRLMAPPRVRYPALVGVLVLAILAPQLVNVLLPATKVFWQQVLVDDVGIFVLLAIGLNVVVGFAGLLDLGYIAFYAIGAYVSAYWTGALPVQPPFHLNPFWTFPMAVAAAIVAGVILGAPTLRLRGDYLAIVTLGFGEIIQIVARNLTSVTGGPQGVGYLKTRTVNGQSTVVARQLTVPHFSIHLLGINFDWTLDNVPYYYLLLVLAVGIIVAFRLLENSRVGRAWTAIREDEVAAEACGINTLKYKIMAFAIGASTSGFAGVLFASKNGFFDPPIFSVQLSILVLVFVIFGGMGSIVGVIVGTAVLQVLPQSLRHQFPQQDLFIYVGALLVVMMIFRPQGLIPSRRRSRELGLAEEGVGGADAMGAPGTAP
ncbi:MAG TPA: branched-chain amino acid ABC transporter permease [Mycobacteriales bacterium]|nr:branched-chain amino acid ABC transporter permease [Mycobacteriales bacterium]